MSIYTRFTDNDIVPANQTVVTTGLWTGDTGSLEGSNTLFLSDTQIGISGEYYLDVYNTEPDTDDLAEVQFAVTYGHIDGGGAPTLDTDEQAKRPTAAIYSQYRNLLLDPTDTKFTFEGVESDHIYVINFNRSRFKEQLDPGNWELPLSGHNDIHTFIDDSNQTLGALTANSRAGRVFRVISGSISSPSGVTLAPTSSVTYGVDGPGYGYVYPDLGIIVLNPNAICPAVGFYVSATNLTTQADNAVGVSFSGSAGTVNSRGPVYNATNVADNLDTTPTDALPYAPLIETRTEAEWATGTKAAYNHAALYVSLKKAITQPAGDTEFRARSAETISSTHYFVRLRNKEYNYSNNPTFRDPDDNTLVVADFKRDPQVYVTTVGLYNDTNELLAVAKLSKPVKKSYEEEVLLRVRLDY